MEVQGRTRLNRKKNVNSWKSEKKIQNFKKVRNEGQEKEGKKKSGERTRGENREEQD